MLSSKDRGSSELVQIMNDINFSRKCYKQELERIQTRTIRM